MDDSNHKPEPPGTMRELLDLSYKDWKFKRKDEAFVRLLNAMAMMSEGVGQALANSEEANRKIDELTKRLDSNQS